MRIRAFAPAIFLAIAVPAAADPPVASSTSYTLWMSTANGGGDSSTSTTYQLFSGFWHEGTNAPVPVELMSFSIDDEPPLEDDPEDGNDES